MQSRTRQIKHIVLSPKYILSYPEKSTCLQTTKRIRNKEQTMKKQNDIVAITDVQTRIVCIKLL